MRVRDGSGPKGENQRRCYRIEDEVILQYQRVSAEDGSWPDGAPPLDRSTAFVISSRLAECRHHMQPMLWDLQKEAPAVSRYLKLLDEKIDILANVILLHEMDTITAARQRVKLSATGIAFHTDRQLPENQLLLLSIILLPSFTGVISEGRVIRSTPFVGGGDRLFLTTVEFVNIRESTEDLIAKHILDRQKDLTRRAQLSEPEPESESTHS